MHRHTLPRAAGVLAVLSAALLAGGCSSGTTHARNGVDDASPALPDFAAAARLAEQAYAKETAGRRDLSKGKTDSAEKKFNEAIDLYRQSIAESRSLPYVWNNLGVLYMESQNYIAAAEAFRNAADLDVNDPRPLENLGTLYHRVGRDTEALRYFSDALTRDPYWLPALRGTARCALRLPSGTGLSDEELLNRVERALMVERDAQWRAVFERAQVRLHGKLAATPSTRS
ncbi:MAG: tetratricopeptide repeat protein [Phycisphaerales bacterium]|nr:tetratricopeptide repeat protein [Phycisphaerales bacterium]